MDVAWSPDGRTVACTSHRIVALWDAASGACRATLSGHDDRVNSVAWSPDGRTVASGSHDKTVKLWDAASGACRATLSGHSDVLWDVTWSPDCRTVASGGLDHTVKLWDAASGALRATLSGHSGYLPAVTWSADGKTVASGSHDGTVKLWDAASGACRATLSGHDGKVKSVAWSPDGRTVASGSNDKTVKLWDAVTGACVATLSGHGHWLWRIAWSPDGRTVASVCWTGSVITLWEASNQASDPAPHVATSAAVPSDVENLLSQLSLLSYGGALVSQLGVTSVADLRLFTEAHLKEGLPDMKMAERLRLINAVAKLGSPSQRLGAAVSSATPALAPAAASSRSRVRALCIGVNAYGSPVPGALANAVNDARAVHEALRKLPGAESTLVTDCTKAALEASLVAFRDGTGVCLGRGMRVDAASAASSGGSERTLGIVFFAGHGLQVSGRNYLVPSDFTAPNKNDKLEPMLRDTARACVSLDLVEEILEDAGVTAGAVLLDCCRNVPDFLALLGAKRSAGGTRTLPVGMRGDAKPSLADLMVTFATAPGTEALDRSNRVPGHSPFTAALLKALAAPRRLVDLNPFLTDEVVADSGGEQRPHVGGSYGTEAGNLILG
jgi:uncharacterized caspase-like protein